MAEICPWIVGPDCVFTGGTGLRSCPAYLLGGKFTGYGSALELVDMFAHCHDDSVPETPWADSVAAYRANLRKLPTIRFYRKRRWASIVFVTRVCRFDGIEDFRERTKAGVMTAAEFHTLCREMASALSMLALRLKPGDDFDLDGYLAQVNRRVAEFDAPPEPLASS